MAYILQVRWAEQLFSKSRVKRLASPGPDQTLFRVKRIQTNNNKLMEKRNGPYSYSKYEFNDELWSNQWYLVRNFKIITFKFIFNCY